MPRIESLTLVSSTMSSNRSPMSSLTTFDRVSTTPDIHLNTVVHTRLSNERDSDEEHLKQHPHVLVAVSCYICYLHVSTMMSRAHIYKYEKTETKESAKGKDEGCRCCQDSRKRGEQPTLQRRHRPQRDRSICFRLSNERITASQRRNGCRSYSSHHL